VTDYVKLANDCVDALSAYSIGVGSNFSSILDAHEGAQTPDQFRAADSQYNTFIGAPQGRILDKCPVNGSSEYLKSDDVNRWKADYNNLIQCYAAGECSSDNGWSYLMASSVSTDALEGQARVVSQ
jgi:hypothetical protein